MPCLHAMCICSYVIQHQHATAVSVDLQYCYTVLTMLRAHRLCVLWSSSYEHILICDAHYVCCIVSMSLCIIGKCQCGNNRALIPWTIITTNFLHIHVMIIHVCRNALYSRVASYVRNTGYMYIMSMHPKTKEHIPCVHWLSMHFQSTATARACSNLHCSCWHSALHAL